MKEPRRRRRKNGYIVITYLTMGFGGKGRDGEDHPLSPPHDFSADFWL
jgi:hypothetical protein